MKVIHILHHSDLQQSDSRFEFDLYQDEFSVRVAKQILKQTKKYVMECWRPEGRLKKIISGEKDGIMYKAFPSFYYKFGKEYSRSLIEELRKELKKHDVLIHLHGIHNYLAYTISYLFRDVLIVGQQHGGGTSISAFKNSERPFRFLYLLNHILEKLALKNVDHFFVLTKYEKESLSKLVGMDKVEIQTMGVDFGKFRPLNKEYAREVLGLPLNKKIILYVGKFDKLKGMDLILDAFKKLKNKYDIELILIGGSKNDMLYNKAKSMGARVIERIPSEQLIPYYSASDVYYCFYNPNLWGGIGIAPVESLACGRPIVSNTLEHFPTDEKRYLGEMPRDEDDVVKCILKVIENEGKYDKCREIAKRYYDWKNIIRSTINVYDYLIEK